MILEVHVLPNAFFPLLESKFLESKDFVLQTPNWHRVKPFSIDSERIVRCTELISLLFI